MDPVFSGITDKVLLTSSGGRVSFYRVPTGSYEIVLFGEFYNQCIVVFPVEWLRIEASCKDWFKNECGFFLH